MTNRIECRSRGRQATGLVVVLLLGWIATGDPAHRPAVPPPLTLWAWERPEDLRFVPAGNGIAYLASTITLRRGTISERPRLHPLKVAPGVHMIALVRIESDGAPVPANIIPGIVQVIVSRTQRPEVKDVQIDFDARRSERDWFRTLIRELRSVLSPRRSLSITALASWCQGDNWIHDLPVDYAVPMLFRLGVERNTFRDAAIAGRTFREPLCRAAVGLSTDEPLSFPNASSVFWFSPTPWNAEQFRQIGAGK